MTAWLAFAALPPTPRKKTRPFASFTFFTPVTTGAQCYRFSGGAAAAQTATAARASSTTTKGLIVTATGDALGTVGDLVGVHYTASAEIVA